MHTQTLFRRYVPILATVALVLALLLPATAFAVAQTVTFDTYTLCPISPCNLAGPDPGGAPINWGIGDPYNNQGWTLNAPTEKDTTKNVIPDVFENDPWATFTFTGSLPHTLSAFDVYNPWSVSDSIYSVQCNDSGTTNTSVGIRAIHGQKTTITTNWKQACVSVSIEAISTSAIVMDNFVLDNGAGFTGDKDTGGGKVGEIIWAGDGGTGGPDTTGRTVAFAYVQGGSDAVLQGRINLAINNGGTPRTNGQTMKLGVYSADSNGPNTLMASCSFTRTTTSEPRFYSCLLNHFVNFTVGTEYWLAVSGCVACVTPTYEALQVYVRNDGPTGCSVEQENNAEMPATWGSTHNICDFAAEFHAHDAAFYTDVP